jgi:site-specific recombinase XerD
VHNEDGSQLTYDTVNNLVDRASVRAGVKIYPHKLRHHYGTRMVRAGVNVIVLSKLLGHANISTTERYVSLDLSDLVEASRLDPRTTNGGIHLVPSHLEDEPDAGEDAGRYAPRNLASA